MPLMKEIEKCLNAKGLYDFLSMSLELLLERVTDPINLFVVLMKILKSSKRLDRQSFKNFQNHCPITNKLRLFRI